jgi:putative ABC transport system substrate-binding protein
MKRREFITLLGGAATWPLAARTQQAGKTYRIGFLANDPTIPTQAAGKAFVEGLRESGFVEGKNAVIERRFADGRTDRASELVAELVRLDVDLILTSGASNAKAAKEATNKIPIVMVNVFDPIALGIVTSLSSPQGNVTGVASHVSPEIAGKRLELLKLAVPAISRAAVLINPDSPQDHLQWEASERAARSLNVALNAVAVRGHSDLEGAFIEMRRERPDAMVGLYNSPNLNYRQPIVSFATENRLPTMYAHREAVEVGGLMSYGASRSDMFRRAAIYVAKILQGTRPTDLPIEQPTKFEFVVNLKTAKALGLTMPNSMQLLADEVIE